MLYEKPKKGSKDDPWGYHPENGCNSLQILWRWRLKYPFSAATGVLGPGPLASLRSYGCPHHYPYVCLPVILQREVPVPLPAQPVHLRLLYSSILSFYCFSSALLAYLRWSRRLPTTAPVPSPRLTQHVRICKGRGRGRTKGDVR
jgi:hypothetical protein